MAEERVCYPKIQFLDRRDATHQMKAIRRKSKCLDAHELNAYICPHCGFWHLGHKAQYWKRRRKQ